MKNTNIKPGLIVILMLTAVLWIVAVPSGNTFGNVLAGLIILVTIGCYLSVR